MERNSRKREGAGLSGWLDMFAKAGRTLSIQLDVWLQTLVAAPIRHWQSAASMAL